MSNRKIKIENASEYQRVMKKIDVLMRLGENMDDRSAAELRNLSLAAQAYEKSQFEIPSQDFQQTEHLKKIRPLD
jgi:hypothetical protein